MADSKSSRKNRKRREGKKTNEEVEAPSIPLPPQAVLADLQEQLAVAKTNRDSDKAQELREKIWALQDTIHLGQPTAGASVDVTALLTPPKPPDSQASVASGNPTEKKLAKLMKKLEQIESLKCRQAEGEQLEKNQVAKIQSEADLREEISILEEIIRTGTFNYT